MPTTISGEVDEEGNVESKRDLLPPYDSNRAAEDIYQVF